VAGGVSVLSLQLLVQGDPQPVTADEGDTVLAALLRAGVGFAYSCEAGNCGTCKCEYVSGDIFELEYSEHALLPSERDKGVILACRTQMWGDTVIRRVSDEAFVVHPSRVMTCKVVEKSMLTHDIVRLRLGIEAGGPFTFLAGQFAKVTFEFAPDRPRDYSMANSPTEGVLEFHLRCVPGGVSAQIPERLGIGDRVRVSGPFGTSYWREQHAGPLLLVAGGSGMAPVRSILAAVLAKGAAQPVHLYFGVRAERDVYGEAELRDWAARHPNLQIHIVLSEATGVVAPNRRLGLVTDAVRADFSRLDQFNAYLAGPPVMVEAAAELIGALGMARRDIHADAFYATGEGPLKGGA